jgi:hypothetical protein
MLKSLDEIPVIDLCSDYGEFLPCSFGSWDIATCDGCIINMVSPLAPNGTVRNEQPIKLVIEALEDLGELP